ncbi:hypothetical protein C7S18_17645 [Ahniella affigens]|uniref:Protein kinase domain-containing protein n=1 Tax=Ahniella affigens TaxID=2021234 RepID=A0A2P1PVL8_9GAMM|nr:serine/threonine-protein kinase [Ahniella affigens]AVP98889.1 hypothetical protein C7S18_17645 [Ahniella affigens]
MNLEPVLNDAGVDEHTSDSRRLGPFRLLKRIGVGGYGAVYEALDERLNRTVAIKILHDPSPDARRRMLSEARASAGLEHPAFVKVLDVFESHSELALVMELVRGQTLSALREHGPLPLRRGLLLIRQIAVAMASAHAGGRVHADLKPANLMLSDNDQVRILDFGLARDLHPDSGPNPDSRDGSGTLAYMAPELLLGRGPHPGSDIYALGAIAAELMGQNRPYAELDGARLAHELIHGRRAPSAQLPEQAGPLRALIDHMCARVPEQRCATMTQVLAGIDEQLNALRTASDVRPPAPHRRHWPWLLTGVLVLAALWLGPLLTSGGTRWPDLSMQSDLDRAEQLLQAFDHQGHVAEAIALLESRLTAQPEHAASAANLAIAYCLRYASDDRDEAWLQRANTAADIALRADPQLARAQASKGWALEFQSRPAEALPFFQYALMLDPGDRYALLGQARAAARLGQDTLAAETLANAMQRHPKDRVFVDALGTWHFSHARYVEAESAFRQAIALDPLSVVSRSNLNAVLLRRDRPEEALAVLQDGLRLRPDGRLYSNLGTVLYALGRYAEATDAYRAAVSAERGSPNDYLRWANLADALRQLPGREQDALAAYRTTVSLLAPLLARNAEDVTLASRSALYRAKLQDCDASKQTAATVRAQPNLSVDVRFRLAQAAELCGAREQALADLVLASTQGLPLKTIAQEPELLALRRDPRYQTHILATFSPSASNEVRPNE